MAPLRLLLWGGIGDALLATPALRAAKQQDPRRKVIVYAGGRDHVDVLRRNPHVDALRLADPRRRPWTFVRACVWPGGPRSTNYGRLRPSLGDSRHASRIIGDLLGVDVTDVSLDLFLADDECARARRLLEPYACPVALHTSAVCSPNKMWGAEQWRELVASLRGTVDWVQVGAPGDAKVPGAADMTGRPLREAFAIIGGCRAFVGIDSGLAHAAHALGTPSVVLFGPSTPLVWGHGPQTNLYASERCSPCIDLLGSDPCPYGRRCMTRLSAGIVRDALLRRLEPRTGHSRE